MADRVDPFAAEFEEQRRKNEEYDELQRINARSTGEVIQRDLRATGTGLNDAIGGAVGAIPDLVAGGVRAAERQLAPEPRVDPAFVGPPAPRQYSLAPQPGQFGKWARDALNYVPDKLFGGHLNPDTPTERTLYAAGHGAGDALATVAPAGAVSRAVRAGQMLGGPRTLAVADQLASTPITQVVSGAAGDATAQATDNPLLGLGVSMAVPFGASAFKGVVSPGASMLNPEQSRLAGVARREGIDLTPGQESGNRAMRTMDSVMKDLPLTSGPAHQAEELQRIAYNRAVLERAGERGSNYATPDVVQGALDRAGQGMTSVYTRNDMQINPSNWQRIQSVADTAHRDLPESVISQFTRKYDDLVGKIRTNQQGQQIVDGPAFASLDSDLSRQIRNLPEGEIKHHLGQLQTAMRNGMAVSITGNDAALLSEYRRQYANGIVIQKAINTPSMATAAGHVPATGLSTVLSAGGNFGKGRGDLNDLARVGRTFIQDPIPNSGTSMRGYMTNLLQLGLAGGGAYGGRDLAMKTLMAGGAMLAPSVIQQLARSGPGRAYLSNQVAANWAPQATRGTMAGIGVAQIPGLEGTPLPQPGAPGARVAPIEDERFQPQ